MTESKGVLHRFIGDRAFYRMVIAVALPILIQNGITNFVSLLDNIMVGRVGTVEMTGVAIANQLVFVFNLCVFGAVSGAGIFTAQYFGKGDNRGVAHTMRFKLYITLFIAVIGTFLPIFAADPIVTPYLQREGALEDSTASLASGVEDVRLIAVSLVPFVLVQCYAGTLRETGETFVPMLAGIVAVLVNLVFNYILIFGHFGAPAMGAAGAAAATVLSRYVEFAIIIIWAHTHTKEKPYIKEVFRSPKIPVPLTKQIIIKGMPLMINEMLWSIGIASLTQCYSYRGLHVVAALNISSTITNLFNVVNMALGVSVSIIVGQLLGAGRMEEAVETDRKLIAFSIVSCAAVGAVVFIAAPLFPAIYNTTADVRSLAANAIRIYSVYLPFGSFLNTCYFTLRSGGKTIITFFFDSFFVCCVSFPAAFALAHFTTMPIIPMYIAVQALDLFKCVLGFILVKKRVWVNNIISNE
ncbi:MAG: MATE family efflux transporter [Clostridia bacterium]|nr:MATE family efflux transporter [Clostridia bacterium]